MAAVLPVAGLQWTAVKSHAASSAPQTKYVMCTDVTSQRRGLGGCVSYQCQVQKGSISIFICVHLCSTNFHGSKVVKIAQSWPAGFRHCHFVIKGGGGGSGGDPPPLHYIHPCPPPPPPTPH